jgi:hypothetical protein
MQLLASLNNCRIAHSLGPDVQRHVAYFALSLPPSLHFSLDLSLEREGGRTAVETERGLSFSLSLSPFLPPSLPPSLSLSLPLSLINIFSYFGSYTPYV